MNERAEHIRTLTTKGQVTIPVEVRRLLGVNAHDKILFRISDGRVVLEATPMTLEATFGAVPAQRQPEDFERLRDIAIEEHARQVIAEMR